MSWLRTQRESLRKSFRSIRGKKNLTVTQPFFRIDSPISDATVFWADDNYLRNDEHATVDIFFNQGYAPDRDRIVYVRQTGRTGVHATWFWDNHHLIADTMHAALLSDVYFCAHAYTSSYVVNRLSLNGGFVPLCPIFWQVDEVEEAAGRALLAPRSARLYGGYNSYLEFPDRDALLERIQVAIPDHKIFMTPHGTPPDQHRFYGMTPLDRMLEWMSYKVSLCVSFGNNTAIRIFDTLLAGGIPLVVGRPHDLDAIISPDLQRSLPIIVVDDTEPEAIASAYRAALERFDRDGHGGIFARHSYIKSNHMPHHRLGAMIDRIRGFAERVDDLDGILDGPF